MAITAVDRRLSALAALIAVGVLSCIRADTIRPGPEAVPAVAPPAAATGNSPLVRVGLAAGAASLRVGGDEALDVATTRGAPLAVIRPSEEWVVRRSGPDLLLESGAGRIGPASVLLLRSRTSGGLLRVNGRNYRGTLTLSVTDSGITAVNELPLEDYLPGVVGAEMGSRPPGDREALEAQAIVSRTYALRNRGRWASQGFDYQAGVSDQVYAGASGENLGAVDAVRQTAGLIVTWNGQPIDAFFFSTCGGRTELGSEVFRGANVAYLHSVSDLAPDGSAYCSISPRFHWRQEFSGQSLRDALRRYLPAAAGIRAERVSRVGDIRVTARTASGRVRTLAVDLPDGAVSIPGPAVRRVLRDPAGDILRSTLITLHATRAGGQVTRLEVDGAGAGHGVGFCQWGAVGRARAGQQHAEIIAAYFPGTRIERAY